jgi:hypothetical protein
MNQEKNFNNILDECLDRVIKGEPVGACLSRYPDYAAELEPLLRTAVDTREAIAIRPRPEFRERAGYQFQAAIREIESKGSRGFFRWQVRWVAPVAVVIAVLLAGSGTVAAASNSLPDGPLYQVKLATEAVQLALTPSALGKAELYVRFADRRVDEIIKMADKGKVEQVEKATERMNSQLIAMASLVVPGRETAVETGISTMEAPAPAPLPAPAPKPAAPVEESPSLTQAPPPTIKVPPPVEQAPILTAPGAPGPSEGTAPAEKRAGGEKGAKPDKQAKFKDNLSQRAAENSQALQKELEKAPGPVKDALRRALDVAGKGYDNALRKLD